jgi:Ribbon-helix-helix protein, copG family.
MKARTIHFPDEVVEALKVLVEHGIFHNVSDAVRQIVTKAVTEYFELIRVAEEYRQSLPKDDEKGHPAVVTIKLPSSIRLLVEKRVKEGGYKSMSDYIRAALIAELSRSVRKEKKE